jgi:GDP-L-fucose synthase
MKKEDKIYIAGHKGMVGSSFYKLLKEKNFNNVIIADRNELDLTDQIKTNHFIKQNSPNIVLIAAAKVGGINSNIKYPADYLNLNLQIQNNLINSSIKNGVEKIIFLGSSCVYPAQSPQPMKEEYLLSGPLEQTNEGYALAKITGIKLLEYYKKQYGFNSLSLMPCNLYGPNDSFDLENSHVLSALVRKIVDAKENKIQEVLIWGTGNARREFMHVDDLSEAILYFSDKFTHHSFINIGCGDDISIKDLASLIARKVNYNGKFKWDSSKPDGMYRKCMDVTKMLDYGFKPKISLEEGIEQMIKIYKENYIV